MSRLLGVLYCLCTIAAADRPARADFVVVANRSTGTVVFKLANETASELQGKPYNVSNDDLVDNRFVTPL